MTDDSLRVDSASSVLQTERVADSGISDEPRTLVRSTVYVLRALIGVLFLLLGMLLLLVFENALLGVRADLATVQESWPAWLTDSMRLGIEFAFIAGYLAATVYLVYRRTYRRWVMITVAGFAGLFLGALLSNLVLAIATSDALQEAIDETANAGLGNDVFAMLIAMLTVGSVWIGPKLRPWIGGFVVLVIAVSFVGGSVDVMTLPFDLGVGLLAGALTALILKTRDRTPTPRDVADTLERGGIGISRVQRASVDARGSVPWFATADDGELFVKTLGADHRASDLLFRMYRMIRLRRAGDRQPFSSLRRAVEHEAFLSLAADARGIRTPQLVTVSEIGSDGLLLAYERIEGRSLDSVDESEVTDDLLDEVWQLVVSMQESAIAHRDLRLANVFVADDGTPWIIDFGFAELAAEPALLARDKAELLASTATVVGPERSVAVALGALGEDGLAEALPWIQPLALSSATRSQLGRSEAYDELRSLAAEAVGADEVEYARIERVKPGTLLVMATIALALYVLVPQIAQATGFLDELTSANPAWVLLAAIASAMTYVGATLGMVGAIPMRLAFWPVVAAQLASSFSNRITPAKVGGMATNVRFMQKQGVTLPMAASAVGLNSGAGMIVHISLLALFGVIASRNVDLPLPDAETTAIVVIVIIVLSGVFMLLPIGRKLISRYLVPALKAGLSAMAEIAKTPVKLLALFAGSALVTVSYTVAMIASLNAFGADVPVATAAAVYLAGSAVATAAPTPGGVGAAEAALIAGYTAVGVEAAVALPAVLLFRLVTFWLPILPGWIALIGLQRTGRL